MEKVSGEVKLLEEMVEFMEKICVGNFEKLTIDDRKALSVARNNVTGVHREMSAVILSSSLAVDVSLIVRDYRSKVEKELNDICSKVSNVTIQLDVKDYVDSFQHDDAVIHHDDIDTYFKKRRKLVLESEDYEQTLESEDYEQTLDSFQHAADDEISAYLRKWKILNLESEDYEQTLEFMDNLFVIAKKEQVSEKDLSILSRAYNTIMMVHLALSDTLDSDHVRDIDVSLTINESRSKVEKELNYICNTVTNHTIKESISRHLDAFKAGHLPKKLLPRIFTDRKRVSTQSEIKTTTKKSKLGSGDGFGYHDHTKPIKKQRVPLYLQINAIFEDSEPKCIGEGFEIQHADDSLEDDCEMSDGIFSF